VKKESDGGLLRRAYTSALKDSGKPRNLIVGLRAQMRGELISLWLYKGNDKLRD
jgi:hypothetical protein